MDAKAVIAIVAIVVGLGVGLIGGLVTIIWKMLNDKIDKVEEHSKIEDRRIADNVHDMRGEMSVWRLHMEKAVEVLKSKMGMK